jgi:hypothetical protein
MEPKKISRENVTSHLLEYELGLIGKDLTVLVDDDRFRFNNTLTRIQYQEFKKYAIKLLKKTFKFNSSKALDTFEWFYQKFGLRIKN